mgnify:FL=1|jgi:hypothetical protein|uniref:DNA-directed RNA polymerase subunit n=1 Tax=Siphoviridae sp. ctuvC1 TaxID=2826507 RepID=A0A8S5M065_9CAUD|nr:MAG TPA: DNA-directed RNA polymerase subunit [Siphoviridae sp. ctuvC1]
MDIEKLIHQLNDIRKRVSGDTADAIASATEIVKKQRPERVLEFTVPVFTTNGHHEEVNVNSCPTCFRTVEHTEFCPHCGQRLIWKDTDGLVTR